MTLSPKPFWPTLAVAGVLALGLACSGGGSNVAGTTNGPATPSTNVIITDAPSDNWSTIQVQVTKVVLFPAGNHTAAAGVTVFSGAASVNLVDLDSVGELLSSPGSSTLAAGTSYDLAAITINSDTSTMNLIPEASSGLPAVQNIVVRGSNVINVALSPAVTAPSSSAATGTAVQIDFDLTNPLFINVTPSGTAVVDFGDCLLQRALPASLGLIQLHRSPGIVVKADTTYKDLVVGKGADLSHTVTYTADASTLYWDVDTGTRVAGSLADIPAGDAVMVSARMQDDGIPYAVRVWYCSVANAANLPKWSPEGHVVSVSSSNGAYTMLVDNADGIPRTVAVDANTTITYHRQTVVAGPASSGAAETALQFMANNGIRHGFKVDVDVTSTSTLEADSLNIERAVDTGYINAATSTTGATPGLVYGLSNNTRSYPYDPNFGWWYYAQPSTTYGLSSLGNILNLGSNGTRVTGFSDLVWNTTSTEWNALDAIILPNPLPKATLSTGFSADAGGGTLGIRYTDPVTQATVANQTVDLASGPGGGQTVVMLVTPSGNTVTTQLLQPANWSQLTSANVSYVWVSAVPETGGNVAAYSVVALAQ